MGRLEELRLTISEVRGQLNGILESQGDLVGDATRDFEMIAKRLEAKDAFVDFLKVRDFSMAASDQASEQYIAFFVLQNGDELDIHFTDVGNASEVDQLIRELRDQTRRVPRSIRLSSEASQEKQYRETARHLYDQLLGPFAEVLISSENLIISPDAGIAKVPFAALVTSDEKYLIETTDVSYVSSARDLMRTSDPAGQGVLIISNPNFDAEVTALENSVAESLQRSANLASLRGPLDNELRSLRWKRLPGAEQEAQDIQEILTPAEFQPVATYTGDNAVEEVFKSTPRPGLCIWQHTDSMSQRLTRQI